MNSSDILLEAREINNSLHRSRQSLYSTLNQTETTREIIETDGNILQNSLQQQKYELRATLQSTKKRLNRIKQAEIYEKYGLKISVGFFTLIVVYICLVRFRAFYLLYSMMYCFFTKDTAAPVLNGEL